MAAAASPVLPTRQAVTKAVHTDASALSAAAIAPQQLWTAYTGFPTCYRQPFLVKTARALLAFVEGRPGIPNCSGTFYPTTPDFPVLVRTSFDDGATFGAAVNITNGNLDFLVAVYDAVRDTTILLIQQGDSGTIQTTSGDNGATWSAPVPVTVPTPPTLASLIPGVGHGLQVSPAYCLDPSCAGRAGRLIVPFVATTSGPVSNDTACGSCATALVYSDDGGKQWALGAISDQNGSREAALVQLDSAAAGVGGAAIYAAERNLGNVTGSRWHALSADAGASFASYGVDALPDVVTSDWTGVVAGVARFDRASLPAAPALVFIAPAAAGRRANLSMWVSHDEAGSWGAPVLTLWPGPAAYSDALQINATHLGIIWEGGVDEFAGGILFAAIAGAGL